MVMSVRCERCILARGAGQGGGSRGCPHVCGRLQYAVWAHVSRGNRPCPSTNTSAALQKLSDPALTHCPACHAEALQKLISAAGFRLKGSGWYETDFKQKDRRNLAGDGQDASGDKAGKEGQAGKDGKGAKEAQGGQAPKDTGGGKTDARPASPTKAGDTGGATTT
jgi:putative FmdB family regulatory protein